MEQRLGAWFKGRRLASITTADVRAYTARRLEQKAFPSTVSRELAALKRIFSLAMQANKVMRRPHIPMLREDNTRKGFFERAQFDKGRENLPPRLRGGCHLRVLHRLADESEISPSWRQVDMAAGTVRLEPGTTKPGGATVPTSRKSTSSGRRWRRQTRSGKRS